MFTADRLNYIFSFFQIVLQIIYSFLSFRLGYSWREVWYRTLCQKQFYFRTCISINGSPIILDILSTIA